MTVKVLIFGGLKELLKKDCCELPYIPEMTVEQVFCQVLGDQNSTQARWHNKVLFAVNLEQTTVATKIHDEDEVALMPPVSGG